MGNVERVPVPSIRFADSPVVFVLLSDFSNGAFRMNPMNRPCHTPGEKPNPCAVATYNWTVNGNGYLHGHFKGWRIAGRELVSPCGVRLPVQRILGLAWRQDAEERLENAKFLNNARKNERQMVKVVVVQLSEFRAFARGAA